MRQLIHSPWRYAAFAIAASVTAAACTSTVATESAPNVAGQTAPTTLLPPADSTLPNEDPSTSSTPEAEPTTPATQAPEPTTTSTTTTTATTTTTTTTAVPLDVFDPKCVVRVESDQPLEAIAASSEVADSVSLWIENGQVDAFTRGDLVDVCPANSVNDIDGTERAALNDAAIQAALTSNVKRQQTKLNELFAGFGIGDLAVDGIPGPRTGQRLCAARLAFGFATTIQDMTPGSAEQAVLFASDVLPTPDTTALGADRWVLIDRTCQMMFVGAGSETAFVFTTSTGSEGYETRDQDRSAAFRFNPALDNGGWHDSSEFPVGVDNPLNGNLYKPLYFDTGQAIHGANNVPPTPQSKGCARLRVVDQNTLVAWLGLDTATGETWRKDEMNVIVNVQGEFVSRS